MSLIDELLENDSTTLNESKKEPIKQKITPIVNNSRFSEIEDISEEISEDINEDFTTQDDFINEPEPTGQTAEFIDNDHFDDIETNELSEQEKKRNFLFAEMRVQMFSIAGAMACQFLSGEWGEEYENKYTPSKAKQKELSKCIAEVMNIEMTTKNPRTTMYEMFAVVFAPILFKAGQIGFRKKKEKKEKAKMQVVKTYEPQPEAQPQNPENWAIPPQKVTYKPQPAQPQPQPQPQFNYIDDKQTAEVETILTPSNALNNQNRPPVGNFAKKETRGRKKGSKRNPKTKKMEQPYKIENGLMFYSWGETKKAKK